MNKFDQSAEVWEAEPRRLASARQIYEAIAEKTDLTQYKSVADYGTGTGLLMIHIQPFVEKIIGFDNSKGMLEQLDKKIEKAKFTNVSAVFHDADKDKLPQEAFDLFVSSMTFHHINKVENFIQEAYNSLLPGGKFLIADLVSEDGSFHTGGSEGIFHLGFDKTEFEEMMQKAGFVNIEIKEIFTIEKGKGNYPIFLASGNKKA